MKILFIANGEISKNLTVNFLKTFDLICCLDGGLNNLRKISKTFYPNYIFGDFDSIEQEILDKYTNFSKIIKKETQEISDLLFGIEFCLKHFPKVTNMNFIGVIGNRVDHSLCNILALNKIPKRIFCKIMGINEDIYFIRKNLELKNIKNKTVSLIPITKIKNINTHGLKWELKNTNLSFGFINGISNIAIEDNIKITLNYGKILLIVNN